MAELLSPILNTVIDSRINVRVEEPVEVSVSLPTDIHAAILDTAASTAAGAASAAANVVATAAVEASVDATTAAVVAMPTALIAESVIKSLEVKVTNAPDVHVTNFPAVQTVCLPVSTFLPVVNYRSKDGATTNYWNRIKLAWTVPPGDDYDILESSVADIDWPNYDAQPIPVALKVTNGTTGHWPNSMEYPIPVTLVQPGSGSDYPNDINMYTYRGPSSSTDWSNAHARVLTGDAFGDRTRLDVRPP